MKKLSRARRKTWDRKLVTFAVASCFAADAYSAGPAPSTLPLGPQVINGQVYFNQNGNLLQITNSSGAIINWQASRSARTQLPASSSNLLPAWCLIA